LSDNGIQPDLTLVSPAVRARRTWELVAAELPTQPRVEVSETAYTFDGDDLLRVVRSAPEVTTLAIVGHNPAMEELIEALAGLSVPMPTSALAVLDGPLWGAPLGSWTIRYAGRPADE
jgi:phosphohistidine phosphatase